MLADNAADASILPKVASPKEALDSQDWKWNHALLSTLRTRRCLDGARESRGLSHPCRDVAVAMKDAPYTNVIAAFDVEDQMRVLVQRPEPQTR